MMYQTPTTDIAGLFDADQTSSFTDGAIPLTLCWTITLLRDRMQLWNSEYRLLPALAVSALIVFGGSSSAAPPMPEQIRALAGSAALAARPASPCYDERAWLERFYASRGYAPAWGGGDAVLTTEALDLLGKASEHGLAPADYANDAPPGDAARFDTGLTLALLRYLAELHVGRVRSPYNIGAGQACLGGYDPVAMLRDALARRQLSAAVDAAAPTLPLYRRLVGSLERYRGLASRPHVPLPPLAPGQRSLLPGAEYAGQHQLRDRLRLLGDLQDDEADQASDQYEPSLTAALKRFQDRHGLDPDGRLGRQTLAALNVPFASRMRQIELSLERLRWLPELPAGPVIAINLPSYRLWAYRTDGAAVPPALAMRVIVGKAARNQTPQFIGHLRHLEFNPYWNLPASIVRAEIVPAQAGNAHYLAEHDMELVDARGATPGLGEAAALAALRSGSLRVRQRPGSQNPLGALKFALPNSMNIYLHGTPAQPLFQAMRRDFSHGCIRLEDPAALAAFVLADQPDWTADAIAAAMAPGATRTVPLRKAVPVILFYATALVDERGRVLFPSDVYQLDAALERALAARRRPEQRKAEAPQRP
jgi:murein L,D-transpeptidase YcbB/YkuD